MKKLFLFIYGAVSATTFTFLTYNLSSILQFFSLDASITFNPEKTLFYIVTTVFYFASFKFALSFFKQPLIQTALAVLLFPVIIDSTVLLGATKLIPLRFPFATLFPFIGVFTGISLIVIKRKPFRIVSLVGVLAFFILCHFILLPSIIWNMTNRGINSIEMKVPVNTTFLNVQGKTVLLDSIRDKKVHLLDFYFVGCPPCELKFPALVELDKKVNDSNFKIILICDGEISSFESFLNHSKNLQYPGFTFLYDNTKVKESITKVNSYPFEILLGQNGEIVSKNIGYSSSTHQTYISNNYSVIKKSL